jgi:hypothetical protein
MPPKKEILFDEKELAEIITGLQVGKRAGRDYHRLTSSKL